MLRYGNLGASGSAQENGSARFQRAASGIPAGRRAKAVGPPDLDEANEVAARSPVHLSGRMPQRTRWKRVLPFSCVLRPVSVNRMPG